MVTKTAASTDVNLKECMGASPMPGAQWIQVALRVNPYNYKERQRASLGCHRVCRGA